MKTFRLLYVILGLIGILTGIQPVTAGHYYFKKISLQDGLPSTIRCILTEEKGFVWIGTRFGLGRFDGHELKRYSHDANNPNSLPHNYIHKITEDKQHNVWILTDKGLARYRRRSDDFYIPKDQNGHNILAYSSCPTENGILFGGRNRIYKYDYTDHSIRLLQEFDASPYFAITALSFWNSDTLLCCSRWMGIRLINIHTGQLSDSPLDCGKEVMGMIVDSQKRIWVAPYNNGIRCYAPTGRLLATYTTDNSMLNNNIVLSMAERDNKIWIGTDGGGLNSLNPETKKFHHYSSTRQEKVASITGFTSNELLLSIFSRGLFIFNKNTGAKRPLPITDEEINKQLYFSGKTVNLYQSNPESVLLLTNHTTDTTLLPNNFGQQRKKKE